MSDAKPTESLSKAPTLDSRSASASGPLAGSASSIDAGEIERFSAIAAEWWRPDGKFKPLHKFNPVRLAYIRDRVAQHFGRDPKARRPLEGLRLLDIGCGGGLLSEPMARLGADVVAVDKADVGQVEVDRRASGADGLEEPWCA